MRAGESLQLHSLQTKNFRGQNLKGKSFRGKDLSGADFSRADIRGADFTNAILTNATFTKAKAGLTHSRAIVLFMGLLLLAVLLGLAVGMVNSIVELIYHGNRFVDLIPQWLALLVLVSFGFVAYRHGLSASFTVFIGAFVVAVFLAYVSTATVPLAGAIAIAILIASSIAVAVAAVITLSVAAAFTLSSPAALVVILAFGAAFISIAVASAGGSAVGIATMVMLLSVYSSQRILRGHDQASVFRPVAIALVAPWGTSFRRADLANADFSQAILKNTDFRGAQLSRTRLSERVGADIPALIS